jgi:hypothetical protein
MDAPLILWLILILSFPTALIINWFMTDTRDMRRDDADNLPGNRPMEERLHGHDGPDTQGDIAREIAARRVAAGT